MNSAQYVKLVIICIFVLFSALSWMYRKFKEQQARQAAKNQALRRREEMLRTGRVDGQAAELPTAAPVQGPARLDPQPTPATVHDEARRRLQELAAQRRRELEAMARRTAGTPAAPGARPVNAPAPNARQRQPVARPQPVQRSRDQARQQANKATKAAEVRRQADKQVANRERQEANRREAEAEAVKADQTVYQAPPGMISADAVAAGSPTPASALRSMVSGVPSGPQDWRRAIVMLELLGPPVGSRDPHQDQRVF